MVEEDIRKQRPLDLWLPTLQDLTVSVVGSEEGLTVAVVEVDSTEASIVDMGDEVVSDSAVEVVEDKTATALPLPMLRLDQVAVDVRELIDLCHRASPGRGASRAA